MKETRNEFGWICFLFIIFFCMLSVYGCYSKSSSSKKDCFHDRDTLFLPISNRSGDKFGVVNERFDILIPCVYDAIRFSENNHFAAFKQNIRYDIDLLSGKVDTNELLGIPAFHCSLDSPKKGGIWPSLEDERFNDTFFVGNKKIFFRRKILNSKVILEIYISGKLKKVFESCSFGLLGDSKLPFASKSMWGYFDFLQEKTISVKNDSLVDFSLYSNLEFWNTYRRFWGGYIYVYKFPDINKKGEEEVGQVLVFDCNLEVVEKKWKNIYRVFNNGELLLVSSVKDVGKNEETVYQYITDTGTVMWESPNSESNQASKLYVNYDGMGKYCHPLFWVFN